MTDTRVSTEARVLLDAAIEDVRQTAIEAAAEVERLRDQLARAEERRSSAERQLASYYDLLRALLDDAGQPNVAEPNDRPGLLSSPARAARTLEPLSGARLRETAVRAALRRGMIERVLHHREWLAWLEEDGFTAAGKRPDAVLITQLSRSPLIERGETPGFYALRPSRAVELRERLRVAHEQLKSLPPPDQMSMLGDARLQRRELEGEVARLERLVEEAWRVLAQERPPSVSHDEDDGEIIVRAWLSHDAE